MEKKCFVCNGELSLFGPRQRYAYYRCTKCATLQLFPMPDEAYLKKAYADLYATAGQTDEINDPDYWAVAGQAYREDILKAVNANKITGPLVDFGAGWGHLCELLIKNGLDCTGVEVSHEMSSHAIRQGLAIRQGSYEALKKEVAENRSGLEAILMCAVFEHLTDHYTWLKRFNRLLPEKGYIVTLHPTAACYTLAGYIFRLWHTKRELPEFHGSFCPPWHTALFSLQAMNIMAERTGFKIIDIRPVSQGDVGGITGLVQQALGFVNRIGCFLLGNKWPLVTTHIFVLQKIRHLG